MHYHYCPRCKFRMVITKHLCPTCGFKIQRKSNKASKPSKDEDMASSSTFWSKLIKLDFSPSNDKTDSGKENPVPLS